MRSLEKTKLGRPVLSIALAMAGAFIAFAQGCTVVTNTTAVQCTSEQECLTKGPGFEGTTCDPVTKTCIKPVESLGCTSNKECLDAPEANGDAVVCRQSRCVRLKTPECPVVFTKQGNSELANEDVIILGALTPVLHTELGTVMERALEMAHTELSNGFLRGLPATSTSAGSRPIAVVACREFGSGLEGLLRAANHLAKDVQVPLVIGPVDPGNGGLVASQAFLPNRILNILPTGVVSSLANLPSPIAPTPLIWRLNYDDRAMAKVTSAFLINQIEPKLLAEGIQPPYRVAVLSGGDLASQSIQAQLLAELKFNGSPGAPNDVAANQAAGSCPSAVNQKCLEIYNFGDINDTLANPNPDAKIASVLADLWNFQPNVVFHTYQPAGIPKAFFPCEGGFPGKKPYHIGVGPVWNGFGPLFPFLNAQQGRNARMFSVQQYEQTTSPPFPVTSVEVTSWLDRFNRQFPEFKDSVSPKSQPVWLLYDSMYLAAYAIASLGDKPVTGENLAQVLGRMNGPGNAVTTYYSAGGPNGAEMDVAFRELKAGQNIDLQGLFGTMNFDTKTGAPQYGLEISCPKPLSPRGGMGGSGFHYKVDSARVVVTTGNVDNPPTSPLNDCPSPSL